MSTNANHHDLYHPTQKHLQSLQERIADLERETERQRTELEHYRRVFRQQHINPAIAAETVQAVVTVDHQRRIMMFTPEFEAMTGYDAQELLGRTLDTFLDEAEHDDNTCDTGASTILLHRRSGAPLAVETHCAPITDAQGEYLGHWGVIYERLPHDGGFTGTSLALVDPDATDESAPSVSIVYILDVARDEIIYMNPEALAVMLPDANAELPIGCSHLLSLLHPDDYDRVEAAVDAFAEAADDTLIDVEFRLHDVNGAWRRVTSRERVLARDADGQPSIKVGVGQITLHEQQTVDQLREVTRQNEEMQVFNDFLRDAAHDLGTPLTAIIGALELYRKQPDPLKKERHIQVIETHSQYLKHIVESMFEMIRLDQEPTWNFAIVDPTDVIKSVAQMAKPLAQKKDVRLYTWSIPERVSIRADSSELNRALFNLLSNAIRFTDPGGTVELAVSLRHRHVIFEVSDTGVGIKPENLKRVFQRFYRVDKARSTRSGGVGLGLSITQKIVERHHGRIEVRSVYGEGSTFTISIPLAE